MPARFEVTLDEEHQIIRQRIDGQIDLDTFRQIEAATESCVARLRDPGCVRILVNAPKLGHANAHARRAMVAALKRANLVRLAIYDATPFARVMIRFLAIVAGVDKAGAFATEAEALAWLLS